MAHRLAAILARLLGLHAQRGGGVLAARGLAGQLLPGVERVFKSGLAFGQLGHGGGKASLGGGVLDMHGLSPGSCGVRRGGPRCVQPSSSRFQRTARPRSCRPAAPVPETALLDGVVHRRAGQAASGDDFRQAQKAQRLREGEAATAVMKRPCRWRWISVDGIGYADQRTQYCGNYKGDLGLGCAALPHNKKFEMPKTRILLLTTGGKQERGRKMASHETASDGGGRARTDSAARKRGQQENAKKGRSANTATACIACMKTHESGQGDKGTSGHTARAWHGFMQLHD